MHDDHTMIVYVSVCNMNDFYKEVRYFQKAEGGHFSMIF
jgi:hypothetical protein